MTSRDEFLVLFLRQESDLRAFIGSLVLDPHIREDVFQECSLALLRQFDAFDRQRSFGAWARGIAANKILQRRHDDRRFPVVFSRETIDAVLTAYDRTEVAASPRADAPAKCVPKIETYSRDFASGRRSCSLAFRVSISPPRPDRASPSLGGGLIESTSGGIPSRSRPETLSCRGVSVPRWG